MGFTHSRRVVSAALQSSEPCSREGSGCWVTGKAPFHSRAVPVEVGTSPSPVAAVQALSARAAGEGLGSERR